MGMERWAWNQESIESSSTRNNLSVAKGETEGENRGNVIKQGDRTNSDILEAVDEKSNGTTSTTTTSKKSGEK